MYYNDNFEARAAKSEKYFYGVFAVALVVCTVLGAVAIKQDMAETREALAAGRKVYNVLGQKIIV